MKKGRQDRIAETLTTTMNKGIERRCEDVRVKVIQKFS